MGGKEFYQSVNGVEEMQQELVKMNADSKRNYYVGLVAAVASVFGLIVAIIALFK